MYFVFMKMLGFVQHTLTHLGAFTVVLSVVLGSWFLTSGSEVLKLVSIGVVVYGLGDFLGHVRAIVLARRLIRKAREMEPYC